MTYFRIINVFEYYIEYWKTNFDRRMTKLVLDASCSLYKKGGMKL